MSTEGWVLASLAGAGVVLTAILVADSQSGHHVGRWVGHAIKSALTTLDRALEYAIRIVERRRLFWVVLLLLVAGWALAIFARGDAAILTQPSNLTTTTLVVAAVASVGALIATFQRRGASETSDKQEWTYPVVRSEGRIYVVGPGPDHQLILVSYRNGDDQAKKIQDLKRQTYAYAATLLKYLYPKDGDAWTGIDQVRSLNALLDKLKAEGIDLSEFAIPPQWTRQPFGPEDYREYVNDPLIAPRLEALIVYLKDDVVPPGSAESSR